MSRRLAQHAAGAVKKKQKTTTKPKAAAAAKPALPARGGARQYHLGVGPDDVAALVMLVGDPGRADKVAARRAAESGATAST
jgi:hypothetical protein